MYDRESLYPGRIKLTAVPGQPDVYDMTRADEPTEIGTPLNKNSLLKDATAALFGLGVDAVPDDVLKKISELLTNMSASLVTVGTYTGNAAIPEDYIDRVVLLSQTIVTPKPIKSVVIMSDFFPSLGYTDVVLGYGMAHKGYQVIGDREQVALKVDGNSFTVNSIMIWKSSNYEESTPNLNRIGVSYHYLVLHE